MRVPRITRAGVGEGEWAISWLLPAPLVVLGSTSPPFSYFLLTPCSFYSCSVPTFVDVVVAVVVIVVIAVSRPSHLTGCLRLSKCPNASLLLWLTTSLDWTRGNNVTLSNWSGCCLFWLPHPNGFYFSLFANRDDDDRVTRHKRKSAREWKKEEKERKRVSSMDALFF